MELREPVNHVSPRARTYWAVVSVLGTAVLLAPCIAGLVLWDARPWWLWALAGLLVVATAAELALIPARYRVHRWEVTPTAVYTRAGWLTHELRIAPVSRVQTVDTKRNVLMRALHLATVTVTTASAAGALELALLDEDEAARVVEHLTLVTAQAQDDAT